VSKQQLRIHNTDPHYLISNLRGEVGEVIVTWTLWRRLVGQANGRRSGSIPDDLGNAELVALDLLCNKLHDELVARLSELG